MARSAGKPGRKIVVKRILVLVLALLVGQIAWAQTTNAVSKAAADEVRGLLATVTGSGTAQERLEAAAVLAAMGPSAVDSLRETLQRTRQSSDEERRAVLAVIDAEVPNEDGRFPRRKSEQRDGDFDWLPDLAAIADEPAGWRDVITDVTVIRALAASGDFAAADAVLDFAFDEVGIIYRDECGRYLRKMAPDSLPTLIRASSATSSKRARARYATYQLDRLDRLEPIKALESARVAQDLQVAVLEAYAEAKPREAVGPVLALTSSPYNHLREAARATWMAYITGPEPKPAPKRRLTLPGGKLTEEEEPLWLNHRELAYVELGNAFYAVMGRKMRSRTTLEEGTAVLFAHYDQAREDALAAQYRRAKELAEGGDHVAAAQAYEQLLAMGTTAELTPERRDTAAAVFLAHAAQLEQAQSWRQAAAVYSKAHGVLQGGAGGSRDRALAGHYFAMGQALRAEGKDGTAALRRAAELDPTRSQQPADGDEAAAEAPATESDSDDRAWMLYAGVISAIAAMLLILLSLVRRRP